MNKYERIYLKAQRRAKGSNASWLDSAIAALAVDLEEQTGEHMEIGGSCGLRAEVIIFSDKRILIVTPSFESGNLTLYYDTGAKNGKHQSGAIGDINGFNNVQAALPDAIEEIVAIMTHRTNDGREYP